MEDQDLLITPEDAQLARRKRRIIVTGSLVLVLAFLFGIFGQETRWPRHQRMAGATPC